MLLLIMKAEKEVDAAQRDKGRLPTTFCLDDPPVLLSDRSSFQQKQLLRKEQRKDRQVRQQQH